MTADTYNRIDLADYLQVIRRRKWFILLVTALCAGLAFFWASSQTVRYQSGAEVQIPDPGAATSANPKGAQISVDTEARVMASEVVAERAKAKLGTDLTPRDLLRHVTVAPSGDALVLKVQFSAATGTDAQKGAQAFADSYIEYNLDKAQKTLDAQKKVKQDAIDVLSMQAASAQIEYDNLQQTNSPTAAAVVAAQNRVISLTNQLNQAQQDLNQLSQTVLDGGTLLTAAPVPKAPSSRSPFKTAVLGGFVGLLLGLALAFVRDRLDQQVRDKGNVEEALGVVSLGSVPNFSERYRQPSAALVTVHAPDSPEADAFRRLRAAVVMALHDADAHVVALTSANAGEGKSTVAANLAVTLSQAGHRVVLLSADARRPSLHMLFGRDNTLGMADVLERNVHVDDVITTIGTSGLSVIQSGQAVGNLSDLLQSERMAKLLADLRERFDLVLVDTPPLLAVADTLGLVPLTDAVIMVVSLTRTSNDEVLEAEEQLQRVGAHLLGAVVNRAEMEHRRYTSYRYDNAPT